MEQIQEENQRKGGRGKCASKSEVKEDMPVLVCVCE